MKYFKLIYNRSIKPHSTIVDIKLKLMNERKRMGNIGIKKNLILFGPSLRGNEKQNSLRATSEDFST